MSNDNATLTACREALAAMEQAAPPEWWSAPTLQDCQQWLEGNTRYEMVALTNGHGEPWWHLRVREFEDESQPILASFHWHVDHEGALFDLGNALDGDEMGYSETDLMALMLCRRVAELYPDGPDTPQRPARNAAPGTLRCWRTLLERITTQLPDGNSIIIDAGELLAELADAMGVTGGGK